MRSSVTIEIEILAGDIDTDKQLHQSLEIQNAFFFYTYVRKIFLNVGISIAVGCRKTVLYVCE